MGTNASAQKRGEPPIVYVIPKVSTKEQETSSRCARFFATFRDGLCQASQQRGFVSMIRLLVSQLGRRCAKFALLLPSRTQR